MIVAVLADCLSDPKQLQVLDVGCGIGRIDQAPDGSVAKLCGVDASLDSIKFAQSRAPKTCFVDYNGTKLPFANSSFDGAFASCVLHHVPPDVRRSFIVEMLRPLRPTGAVIVIERNPLNPVTRRCFALRLRRRCAAPSGQRNRATYG
jgi:ubiquinone/menaquinone biosynthesis C-methylase UbiE